MITMKRNRPDNRHKMHRDCEPSQVFTYWLGVSFSTLLWPGNIGEMCRAPSYRGQTGVRVKGQPGLALVQRNHMDP